MAFTGSATQQKISENIIRITGLSLAASAAGTIGFPTASEVDLVPCPNWQPYGGPDGTRVTLAGAVWVTINYVTDVAGFDELVRVTKAGEGHADFIITFTNDDGDVATPQMEIYLHFH